MYPEKEIKDMALSDDFDGIHFGLYHNYELTGVVSLFEKGTIAQFRKMAVLPEAQGIEYLWCNARTNATEFYKKIGFATIGEAYLQNQIQYIKMQIKV